MFVEWYLKKDKNNNNFPNKISKQEMKQFINVYRNINNVNPKIYYPNRNSILIEIDRIGLQKIIQSNNYFEYKLNEFNILFEQLSNVYSINDARYLVENVFKT